MVLTQNDPVSAVLFDVVSICLSWQVPVGSDSSSDEEEGRCKRQRLEREQRSSDSDSEEVSFVF